MSVTWNKFYTCSKCKKIDYQSNAQYLDGDAICHTCLDEIRFGAKRKACAERGYHVTKGTSGEFVGRQPHSDQPWPFRFQLTCECNQSTIIFVDVPVTPLLNNDDTQMEVWGIGMRGYSMPAAPKRWFLLEGRATVLAEEEPTTAN